MPSAYHIHEHMYAIKVSKYYVISVSSPAFLAPDAIS